MGQNRLFWPQATLDEWLIDEKASIDGDILFVKEISKKYRVAQAVLFEADVGDGSDPHRVVGRVKETATLAAMGGEHYMDSVLLGDSAYKVTPGFTGVPVDQDVSVSGFQTDNEKKSEDRELLARFLLDNL